MDDALSSVTVVVSVLNAAGALQQCIDSVLCQTHRRVELVVIDGGSVDGTREILERNTPRLAYWVSEPDHGIYHAWNKALAHARNDWICFLGADDYLWAPDTLERLAPFLARAYPPTRLVYGEVAVVNEHGGEMARAGENWNSARRRFGQIMCLPHTGLMHHRSLFETHGQFDDSFRIGGDYEMLLRELRNGDALFVPDVIVAGMRHGGVSSDPAGSFELLREFRRAQRMHGIDRPGWQWIAAYARACLRVSLWRVLGKRVAPRVFDVLRMIRGKDAYWTRQ